MTTQDAATSDSRRRRWALALNVVAPGAGLVLMRREWLGLALAMLFALTAHMTLLGAMLAPALMPAALTWASGAASVVLWLWAQALAWTRARTIFGPDARRELELLLSRATEALAGGQYAEAQDLIRIALRINDEDVRPWRLGAQLATLTGRIAEARGAWLRVLALDAAGHCRREAIAALESLPDTNGSADD